MTTDDERTYIMTGYGYLPPQGVLPTADLGDLTAIESDPRMLDLAMRQRKALTHFIARQSQDYLRLALEIRREQL